MSRMLTVGLVAMAIAGLAPGAQARMSKREKAQLGAALIVAGVATYAYAPNLVDQDKVTELENLADYADAAGLPYTAPKYREQAGDECDQAAQGRLAGEVLVAGGLVLLGSSAERDLAGSPLKGAGSRRGKALPAGEHAAGADRVRV